jgi:hypothetical protein
LTRAATSTFDHSDPQGRLLAKRIYNPDGALTGTMVMLTDGVDLRGGLKCVRDMSAGVECL